MSLFSKMPTLPKKNEESKPQELKQTSRLEKITANRSEEGMAYEYDAQDKRELVFNDLKKRYADSLKLSYQWVMRVKQEETPSNKGGEFLVYYCNESLTDRDNNDHHYDSLLGVWPAIEARGKINPESGQREKASVKRTYNVFDIPYSAGKAKEIIEDDHLVLQPSQFLIGMANDEWGEVVRGRKWVVFNTEEFMNEEFDVLLWAAEHGYLEKQKGGAARAKEDLEGERTAHEEQQKQQEKQKQPEHISPPQEQIPPKKK